MIMGQLFESAIAFSLFLCSTAIIILPSRRWLLGLLALQYVGVFLLVSFSWPLEIAVVKLVAGWMATTVLFLTQIDDSSSIQKARLTTSVPGTLFMLFAAFLIGLSMYSLMPAALRWFLGASPQQVLGGVWLLGLGTLQVSFSRQEIRIIIGLLTVISGFEVLYATLEASVFMTGLLALLNISLAFVGTYLQMAPSLEESL
jgi:hypothetical protein